jgi:predicted 3-demethylubiquinone-9 3-methyltransferase (glyoxalase superfamily)
MKKITPFLWFDAPIEQVMKYYCSIFKDAKILGIRRAGGTVATATFRLHGQEFMILNGGPHFKFNPAVSFFVDCKSQAEVDELWEKLSKGGEKSHCGWLKDKYGLSWQIIPSILMKLLEDKNRTKANRVWKAMLQMSKIEIKVLKAAYAGK